MPLEQGKKPPAVHFAQINEKDGFFLAGRSPDTGFSWDKLKGKKVIVDHGGQPMAMFKYACFKKGLDFKALTAVDAGSTENMIAAFRKGDGDYVHLQGPAPQQLEHDGVGHIVASLGDAIGPCAFSSLAATREWLATDMAKTFMRAYRKARAWLIATPAAEVAKAEAAVLQGHRSGRADPDHRHLPEARQLDAARGDHASRPSRPRSTSSSTPASSPSATPTRTWSRRRARARIAPMCRASMTAMKDTIGWIGVGSMGHRMSRHLAPAGYPLVVADAVSTERAPQAPPSPKATPRWPSAPRPSSSRCRTAACREAVAREIAAAA